MIFKAFLALGAILEASRAVMGRSDTQTGENLKILQKRKENICLLSLGGLLEPSWKPPGAS